MSEKEKMLIHKRVKSLLKFYPDTGKFIWRTSPSRNITAGCIAEAARDAQNTRLEQMLMEVLG